MTAKPSYRTDQIYQSLSVCGVTFCLETSSLFGRSTTYGTRRVELLESLSRLVEDSPFSYCMVQFATTCTTVLFIVPSGTQIQKAYRTVPRNKHTEYRLPDCYREYKIPDRTGPDRTAANKKQIPFTARHRGHNSPSRFGLFSQHPLPRTPLMFLTRLVEKSEALRKKNESTIIFWVVLVFLCIRCSFAEPRVQTFEELLLEHQRRLINK